MIMMKIGDDGESLDSTTKVADLIRLCFPSTNDTLNFVAFIVTMVK